MLIQDQNLGAVRQILLLKLKADRGRRRSKTPWLISGAAALNARAEERLLRFCPLLPLLPLGV